MPERNRNTLVIPSLPLTDQELHQMTLLEELFDQILDYPTRKGETTLRHFHFDPLQNLPRIHPAEYYMREKNKQKKKRRCINPKNMPEIRVLRRDIRRKYGEMMMNVTNTVDLPLYEQFFKEFGVPDLRTVIRRSVANKLSSAIDVVVFGGKYPGSSDLKKFVDSYALNAAMMPDWTFKVQDCQIRMRQGYQGSVIVLKTMMKGTRIFSVEPKGAMGESDGSVCTELASSDSSVTSRCSSYNPFEERSFKRLEEAGYIDRRNYEWIIADPPLETTAEVIFMMILDETHHIQQYHIDYNLISERPTSYPSSY